MDDVTLAEYICDGSIAKACKYRKDAVLAAISDWKADGDFVAGRLGFEGALNEQQRQRIFHFYLPTFRWAQEQVTAHKLVEPGKPLVLGISAPQGCGKTTIVAELQDLFQKHGYRCASVSMDDFYMSHTDLLCLAAEYPDNRLLHGRGNAGTHDMPLGGRTLRDLCSLREGEKMAVPRYCKSAFNGAGDRADIATWPAVSGPLDVVLFEGWMLGFKSVGKAAAAAVEPSLADVDELLKVYSEMWDAMVNAWLVVQIDNPKWVFKWRLEAEQKMKAEGKAGMTDEQVEEFVSRYMPAYSAYLPGLYSTEGDGLVNSQAGQQLRVGVDYARCLTSAALL